MAWTIEKSFDLGDTKPTKVVGREKLNAGNVSTPLDYNLYVRYGNEGKGKNYFRLIQDCEDPDLFRADKTFRWRNQYGGWKYEPMFKHIGNDKWKEWMDDPKADWKTHIWFKKGDEPKSELMTPAEQQKMFTGLFL